MMNKLTHWRAVMMTTSLLSAACAAMASEHPAYKDGWRHARVVALVDAPTPVHHAYKDCRPSGTAHAPGQHYAVASYAFGGSPTLRHTIVVPLPEGLSASVGQLIHINVEHCAPALPAETADH